MKVESPLGKLPVEFQRIERRDDGLAVVGSVVGLESSLIIERRDAVRAAKAAALPIAGLVLLAGLRRRRS